jgi:NAD(P)-dependent dehydrogenase (short-subunit alcohol dehydrogenase family)
MQKSNPKKPVFQKQSQRRPGAEYKMQPLPVFFDDTSPGKKLDGRNCVITGGDSGIGRAVAVAFAQQGANVAILFLKSELKDAEFTASTIKKKFKRECILIPADLANENNCLRSADKIIKAFKTVDVLVNNAGVHYPVESILKLSTENLLQTFSVNVFSMFWLTKAFLPFMKRGSSIINSASVVAYRGSAELLDYSASKGAIVSFTRSLSANLVDKGIRVNGVAPGPVWTPLVPSSFPPSKVATYGTDSPMKRAAQPVEVAHAYVFLASADASYITGQFIHVNGGEIVNG